MKGRANTIWIVLNDLKVDLMSERDQRKKQFVSHSSDENKDEGQENN